MIYRFGEWELDRDRRELRRAGAVVSLQPKPFELLALLLAERERVVPKDELLDRLWPGTVVTESSLTRAVSLARRAIGDDGRRERIRSVSRRGYRFVGEVAELSGASAAPAAAAAEGAPAPNADPFVGRAEPLAALGAAWDRARSGAGRLVFVSGEAGIGKSRLVDAFSASCGRAGAAVLLGRCEQGEGAPAFWPWVQVLRRLARHVDLRALADELGVRADEVAPLVPELARADAAQPEPDTAAQGRFLFFDAVARLLGRAARARPLVLVLEDLQWARSASLQLLEHLAGEMREMPLLLIGTVRDEPRDAGHPLSRSLGLLGRLDHTSRIVLRGFSRDEVAALVASAVGGVAPQHLVEGLFERTEGNPLFVREALRLLADEGQLAHPELIGRWRLDRLPERIRDVVRRHLETLSPACVAVLEAGAALGRSFAVGLAATTADRARAEALDDMDAAVAAGVLEPVAEEPGLYRFVHALFQEVTYAGLGPGRRARLHQRAGEAIEAAVAPERRHLALPHMARHFHLGLAAGDPERALARAVEAAEIARAQRLWEQAAVHYEQALDALEQCDAPDPERRLGFLIELGESVRFAGDRARRREVLTRALDAARALDRPHEFARAAIGFCDLAEWSPRDAVGEAVLAGALERLGETRDVERVRVLTRLAYLSRRDRSRGEPMAREAVERSQELDDPTCLYEASYVLELLVAGPDGYDERRALVQKVRSLAPRAGYRDLAVIGLLDLACDALSQGDPASARKSRAEAGALAGDAPHRLMRWSLEVYDAGLAHLEGRLAEAEVRTREAFALGQQVGHPYAPVTFAGQSMALMRERGPDTELARRLATGGPANDPGIRLGPSARAVTASFLAESGELALARDSYERLAADGFEALERGSDWLLTMTQLAELCVRFEDTARAAPLYALLRAEAGLHAVLGVVVCYGGPISRALGRLAGLLGRGDDARNHLLDALEECRALGARAAVARIHRDLGLLARAHGQPGADEHLRRAVEEARALGMSLPSDPADV